MNGSVQYDGQTPAFAPCGELMHVQEGERGGIDGTRTEVVEGIEQVGHHRAEIDVPNTLSTG